MTCPNPYVRLESANTRDVAEKHLPNTGRRAVL